ncbi:hypothetical protein K402DRAFT_458268 [Aulographum hederae CBS 113979]|uniref:Alpha/beta hydrolase n=1 Tax=Aulographum hederae CBS 113979 TaxID=1176131 RepID=A0A6G1GK25_9PEZI|nr:hypothetical protein K402DRAFT_458268 [Aulographum hederae CBS 113979]
MPRIGDLRFSSGRSARAPDALRKSPVEHRTAKAVWERFRLGPPGSFEERRVWRDGKFPVESFDALVAGQAVRRRDTDAVEGRGIVDAVGVIAGGMCDVIAHSHGAALLLEVLGELKTLIRRLVLVEPGGTADATLLTDEVKGRTAVVWGDHIDEHPAWRAIRAPFDDIGIEVIDLPALGIKGNTHFPMSDRNSDEVAELIVQWLDRPAVD